MEKVKIGFIGLGNMGQPMAKQLLEKEYEVYGYDISEASLNQFKANNGHPKTEIKEVLENVEVIFVSLPSPPVIEAVYFGDEGILKNAKKDLIIVDTSTVSTELNCRLEKACAEHGVKYLGAPVSGGVIGAVNGTLTFMVGGATEVLTVVRPLLEILGANIFHVGNGADSGTIIKLINNLMIGFYTQAVGEALLLGEKMGLDPDNMYEMLNVSYGQSRIYDRNYKEYIKEEDFEPGFSNNLLLKDLKLAQQMAEGCDMPLPIGDKLVDWYEEVVESGFGDNDMSSVYLKLKSL